MGKRQLGQLEPFDLVTALMISELAVLPMEDNRLPLTRSFVPIITIVMLQVATSFLQLKSEKIRTLFNGEPSILIKDGKVDIDELRNQRFNLDDLLEELRLNGYFNIADIHYAILETNGTISVMPRESVAPLNARQLNISLKDNPLPLIVISDGIVNKNNLKELMKNETWLKKELRKHNIFNYKEVFLAIVYENDKVFIQPKSNTVDFNASSEYKSIKVNNISESNYFKKKLINFINSKKRK
ncbi:MAG: YetF domain-containing protein [Clostridium sp.]